VKWQEAKSLVKVEEQGEMLALLAPSAFSWAENESTPGAQRAFAR
jgi:hypothetical protein